MRSGTCCELAPVESQRVGFDQGQLFCGEPCSQSGSKVAIDLDRADMAGALDQRARQRCLTGPDLDDGLSWTRIDRLDDSCDDVSVMQEVLPEALACPMRLRRRNVFAPVATRRPPRGHAMSLGRPGARRSCGLLLTQRAAREFDRKLQRGPHAAGIRAAGAGQIERGAVVNRSSNERQAQA